MTHLSEKNITLINLLIFIFMLAIYAILIMIIWNNVLIKKFPSSDIQKLTFLDSIAISILTSLLFKGYTVLQVKES